MKINAQWLMIDLRRLREFGASGTGVVRPSLSEVDMAARRWLVERMQQAGLEASIDGVGNVVGRSRNPGPALLVRSHSDTQPRGGWLDCAMGVIYGLEAARALAESPATQELAVDALRPGSLRPPLMRVGGARLSHEQKCAASSKRVRSRPISEAISSAVSGPTVGMTVRSTPGFDSLGRVAAGYQADIVFLDLDAINLIPLNDPVDQLVHTEDGSSARSVMIAGRMVVEDRRVLGIDLAKFARDAEQALEHLQGVNAPNKALYDRLETVVSSFCPGLARQPFHVDRYAAPLG